VALGMLAEARISDQASSRSCIHYDGGKENIVAAGSGPELAGLPIRFHPSGLLKRLIVTPCVCFFVGENGSGKSTLEQIMSFDGGHIHSVVYRETAPFQIYKDPGAEGIGLAEANMVGPAHGDIGRRFLEPRYSGSC
jgi:hypothetical protein